MNGTTELSPAAAREATPDGSNKRKRESSEPSHHQNAPTPDLQRIQIDILEVLQRQDTQPSFLNHEFLSAQATEPVTKKTKLAQPAATMTSIAEKLGHGRYASLESLQQDAAHVSKELVTAIRTAEKADGQTNGRPPVADLKRIQKITALEQSVLDILERESRLERALAHDSPQAKQENGTMVNGYTEIKAAPVSSRSGTVLTLFGNAPTPKQLFSSMQHPADGQTEAELALELPVEEMSLPNGLSATKVMQSGTADAKSAPTFEETFPAPYSLPSLHPPKSQKRAVTRDNSVTWEFKDTVARNTKRGGYTTQSLTTTDWLGWGGVDPVPGSEPGRERRKQRDRALSSGAEAMQSAPTKVMLEAELVQQEEALFRRAFSSFAPTHDDAKSFVPSAWKSMAWYAKQGNRRFDQVFADNVALADLSCAPMIDPALLEPPVCDEDFARVIEELDNDEPEDAFSVPPVDKTSPEAVLQQISELLETLASHQRIRNATVTASTSASRTPMSPAPILASRAVKADSPADDEVATYNKLRHEIAYLVLKLPPYAVAKLDGDQLADLGVGKLLPFDQQDYRGSMEEDQVSRAAKYAAAATANSLATLSRGTSSSSGQHYSSISSRTPAIGAAANTRYGQSASRPSSTMPAFQRAGSGTGNYNTPTAASRSSYQPSQYTRPGAPAPQSSNYTQPNGSASYYNQPRPQASAPGYGGSNSYNTPSYAQNSTPQQTTAARPTHSSSQPLQQFRASANTSYASSNAAKPLYAAAALQTRPSYGSNGVSSTTGTATQGYPVIQPGSGRATPTFSGSQPQTPVPTRGSSGTPKP